MLRNSWRIASLAGIDLKLHVTFPLVVALGAWQWGNLHGGAGALFGALLVLGLFACVALHELGHALAARYFGIPTREIVLFPLGGVALLARSPRRPSEELWIALAGPAVNVGIAALLALVLGLAPAALPAEAASLLPTTGAGPSLGLFLHGLLAANLGLVAFNLLPVFPMDGGRVLRALLGARLGWQRGTRWAAAIGQTAAVAGGALALLSGHLLLALLAAFVYFAAGQERLAADARHVLSTLRLSDAYNRHALVLVPSDRLSRVVHHLLTSYQPDFAVVEGGRLAGVVTREQALAQLSSRTDDPPVAEWMTRRVPELDATLSLEEAQARLADAELGCGAVVADGRYLGLVSVQDLAEALAIAAAMGEVVRREPSSSTVWRRA